MILRYYGHALFTLQLESGYTILTDPYGSFHDYPVRMLQADLVSVSHHHFDHDALGMVAGKPVVLDTEEPFLPAQDVCVRTVASWHDARHGALRGPNLIFVFEAEGLRVVHLGDLGHVLSAEQAKAIGTPDVLLTPVGGTYTTDAAGAARNVALLHPRVTIPMHYQTRYSMDLPITDEKPFLQLSGADPKPMALCRFTSGDISERPPVMLMQVTP
jgi:L-ascorbate metabolism protein UlaG (beta-lactamase superfamily)